MFETKKKLDSKIRFKSRGFKSQLKQARGYKRQQKARPEKHGQILLSRMGLGSWISRLMSAAALLFLIYLVFIPNPFFVKHLTVSGLGQSTQADATGLINSYLDKNTPWPQKNLLLLSAKGLSNFIKSKDQEILSVDSINKKFPNTLSVSLTPRIDTYLLEVSNPDPLTLQPTSYFSVSSDGLVTKQLLLDSSSTLPTNLLLVEMDSGGVSAGQQIFSSSTAAFLSAIKQALPGLAKAPIDHLQLESAPSTDLLAYLKNSFLVKLDLTSDAGQALNQLSTLVSNLSPGQIKNLGYVDLRFKDRAYVCYQNSPCMSSPQVPSAQATTTPITAP